MFASHGFLSRLIYCMKLELKQKLLEKLKSLTEEDIVNEAVYKCVNDGMVCFNGMVAELVNGCKYDPDEKRAEIEDELYREQEQYEQEDLMREKRSELENAGLNNNEIQKVLDRMLYDGEFDTDVEIDYSTVDSRLNDQLADDIIGDLTDIYESNRTRSMIDDVHVAWCNSNMDFDVAVAEVEEIITNNE